MELPLGRDSVSWRVANEPVLVAGAGGRALLLQVAHPLVAAGVEQHSDYRQHPWQRLLRTLDVMFTLTFGDQAESADAQRLLRRRHAEVRGTADDGTPYRALDPALLLWVWATLVDTMAVVHDRFVRPLSGDERDRLYEEQGLVALACGVPPALVPADRHGFDAYVAGVIADDLRATTTARAVARSLVAPPIPWPVRPAAGAILGLIAFGQLPPTLRRDLGYGWTPGHQAALEALSLASRAGARIVPGVIRRAPGAIANRVA